MSASIWNIDPTHSEVKFKVKHLVISTVTGSFNTFAGTIEADGDGTSFENAKATFTADTDSIFTNNKDRDAHLKSDDFFNAEKFPQLKFESTKFITLGEGEYKVLGKMTIRDITKEVELIAEHGGTTNDPYGNIKAGFEITGTINRKEFGLKWSAVTEAGSVVVGDKVKLELNVQFVKS